MEAMRRTADRPDAQFFQCTHTPYTERHRNVCAFVPQLNRFGDSSQRELYLTYHKFAKAEQVTTCYPQFKEFLNLKRKYDPSEQFQSDWYRYYQKLFAS
jgi:hypothetical protein